MAKSRITPEQKARRAQLGQLTEGAGIKSIGATRSYTETGSIIEDLRFYRLTIGETVSNEEICMLDFGNEIMSLGLSDLYDAIKSVAYENGMLFVAFDASEPLALAVNTSSGGITGTSCPSSGMTKSPQCRPNPLSPLDPRKLPRVIFSMRRASRCCAARMCVRCRWT